MLTAERTAGDSEEEKNSPLTGKDCQQTDNRSGKSETMRDFVELPLDTKHQCWLAKEAFERHLKKKEKKSPFIHFLYPFNPIQGRSLSQLPLMLMVMHLADAFIQGDLQMRIQHYS